MESIVKAIDNTIQSLNDFAEYLYQLVLFQLGYISSYFFALSSKFFAKLIDFYEEQVSFFLNISDSLYDLAKITELTNAYNAMSDNPDICYVAQTLSLSLVLKTIVSAYLIRFGIRRLPFIG